MKEWSPTPIVKIYEALGAVADGRLEIEGNTAKCWSSSGGKYDDISFDPDARAIMVNDNGSYWKGYLGYPAVAFLLAKEIVPHKPEITALLKGVKWKDINRQFQNDFEKALEHVLASLSESECRSLEDYVKEIDSELRTHPLSHLGKKKLPPKGY